ncbi:MAG: hypothetical protein NTY34_00305 [Candidatus Omnitrophica bacterium]|nr:hypothetical protein [Candidatus Omnitrophota bacterium]
MAKMKNSGLLRAISIVLVTTFVAFDISWAYPLDNSERSTLATQGILQQSMMTAAGAVRQDAIFSNMKLLTTVRSIAKELLYQKMPLKYLESTLLDELKIVLAKGINLSKVDIKDPTFTSSKPFRQILKTAARRSTPRGRRRPAKQPKS